MKFFIQGKHWQVFLVLLVLPVFISFITMFSVMFKVISQANEVGFAQDPDPFIVFRAMGPLFLMIIVLQWINFIWHRTLASFFMGLIPDEFAPKTGFFNFSSIFVPILGTALMAAMYFFIEGLGSPEELKSQVENPAVIVIWVFIVMGLSLLSTAASIYIIYFLSKAMKTAELQKEVSFSDYLAEFLFFWFFPIFGVFFLQPKINDMVQGKHLEKDDNKPHEYQN